ncbi:hypothetical protein JDV02_007170 [Purpureocillium takamizusanense]|uniref:Transmembrane protein n=1 Tax=Purpureocillium takamizusanense TaxID=2060973 RepID=A0A9Q8VC26_9HYPO|nr:uncharacterized protein JDV02_007170 [Purpureocillium takamizusanense]UNI21155.1 hypothetical protein JDV02_007170 [Purpureocillium takamizusanense]
MAPVSNRAAASPDDSTSSPPPLGSRPWVVISIVFGALCVVGITASLIHRQYKKRRPYREVAGGPADMQPVVVVGVPMSSRPPSLTATWPKPSPSLSIGGSMRSMRSVVVVDDEELEAQRAEIIRKSLASRASSHDTLQQQPLPCYGEGDESYPRQHGEQQVEKPQSPDRQQQQQQQKDVGDTEVDTPVESPVGMVRDWKRWEAGVRQDRSRSLAHHPSMEDTSATDARAAVARSLATSPPAHRPLTYPATTDVSLALPFGGRQLPMYSPLSPVGEAENEYTHF